MLSSVSKLADKAFVIGFLLPSLVFLVVYGQVFGCPCRFAALCSALHSEEPFAELTYFALIVWLGAVLLLALNYFVYRLYEGYFAAWQWLRFPLAFQKWRRARLSTKLADAISALKKARTENASAIIIATLQSDASAAKRTLTYNFPAESFVLPTLFGNRLRAFETYSYDNYGADAIPIWARLSSVMPASFKTDIETARSQVNFFLNLSILSWFIAAIAGCRLVAGVVQQHSWPSDSQLDWIVISCGVVLALITYYVAAAEVDQWGETVRAAFDCYLPALAAQLGYELPNTEADRWNFWQSITKLFLYRRKLKDKWTWAGSHGPRNTGDDDSGNSDDDDGD
jgi:hypothetical protein